MTKAMERYWLPLVLNCPHTFLSTLCIASAHLDAVRGLVNDSLETITLRQEVVHVIGQCLTDAIKNTDDQNLMALVNLIASEVVGREKGSLRWHEDGIEVMIKQRGGLNNLGERLASTISWVLLESSIIREGASRTMIVEYCLKKSTVRAPGTAVLLDSPLHCSSHVPGRFQEFTPPAWELLAEVRSHIEWLLGQNKQRWCDSKIITSSNTFQPLPKLRNLATVSQADWRYEAIRIAALLTSEAIEMSVPLSQTLGLDEASRYLLRARSDRNLDNSTDTRLMSGSSDGTARSMSSICRTHYSDSTEDSESPIYTPRVTHDVIPQVAIRDFSEGPRELLYQGDLGDPSVPECSASGKPFAMDLYPIGANWTSQSSHGQKIRDIKCLTQPFFTAHTNGDILQDLKHALEHSDLTACWSEMAGILLWISFTASAASKDTSDRSLSRFFSALMMRVSFLISFEHPEVMNASLLEMVKIIEALNTAAGPSQAASSRKG